MHHWPAFWGSVCENDPNVIYIYIYTSVSCLLSSLSSNNSSTLGTLQITGQFRASERTSPIPWKANALSCFFSVLLFAFPCPWRNYEMSRNWEMCLILFEIRMTFGGQSRGFSWDCEAPSFGATLSLAVTTFCGAVHALNYFQNNISVRVQGRTGEMVVAPLSLFVNKIALGGIKVVPTKGNGGILRWLLGFGHPVLLITSFFLSCVSWVAFVPCLIICRAILL